MSQDHDSAARQAQWLAEVALALEEAQRLTGQLAKWRPDSREAVLLRVHIMAVRAEVDALQHHRTAPKWSKGRPAPRADRTP